MTFQPFFERFRWVASGIIVAGFLVVAPGMRLAQAQDPAPAKAAPAKAAPAKAPAKPLEPEQVELITRDDVKLQATYYPSTLGKEAIPVIILHDSKTPSRNAYHTLALALQADGQAVLVPDMRGYGESTKIRQAAGLPDKEFDAKKMGTVAYERMVTNDMEKLKSFLKGQNDDGKLNLNQLCVIGVGDLGCSVAINWTVGDWNFQDLNKIKQSKDVHALILISPETNFKNLQIPKVLTPLAQIQGPAKSSAERLSFFFIVGGGKPGAVVKPKEWRTVKGFADTVERFHPEPPKNLIKADKTLFFGEMPTTLQSGDLLSPAMLDTPIQIDGFQPVKLQAMILTFIDWRLREKATEFPWSSRKIPGG
jgi:pimeloyl-ACP methyl ester carboxylesterase